MTRVYVPATLPLLASLASHGSMPVGDDAVIAPDGSEEGEYAALTTAAETAALLVAELDAGKRRRVVIVGEVSGPADALALADVVAVHADAEDLPAGADPEDLDDLGWYATQEIPYLLQS